MGVPFHFQSTLKFTLCPTVAGINFQLGFSLNHHFRLTRPSRPALSSTGRDTFLHTAHTSPLFILKTLRWLFSFSSPFNDKPQTVHVWATSHLTQVKQTQRVRGVSGDSGDQGRDVGQRVRHSHRRFEFISRRKSAFNCILRRKAAARRSLNFSLARKLITAMIQALWRAVQTLGSATVELLEPNGTHIYTPSAEGEN